MGQEARGDAVEPDLAVSAVAAERWSGGSYGAHECVLAPNPGSMTLDGTNTWILRGESQSYVIDPGPSDVGHLDAVRAAAGDVAAVLLTHHHFDHSESAREFAESVGAPVRALDPAWSLGAEGLRAGEVLSPDSSLEVHVVATPGHTADSLSFWVPSDAAILTGDTVLGRGTTVVAHPDGALGAYLNSLDRLRDLATAQGATAIWPGHGPVIGDAMAVLDYYVSHRMSRLAQVEAAVATLLEAEPALAGPVGAGGGIEAAEALGAEALGTDLAARVVELVYADVDRVLWGAAELSVRAQLAYLATPSR